MQDCTDLLSAFQSMPSEVFMAEYLKRKMSKELRHSGNDVDLQRMVDEGKRTEWLTLLSKPNAVKLHYGRSYQEDPVGQIHWKPFCFDP